MMAFLHLVNLMKQCFLFKKPLLEQDCNLLLQDCNLLLQDFQIPAFAGISSTM